LIGCVAENNMTEQFSDKSIELEETQVPMATSNATRPTSTRGQNAVSTLVPSRTLTVNVIPTQTARGIQTVIRAQTVVPALIPNPESTVTLIPTATVEVIDTAIRADKEIYEASNNSDEPRQPNTDQPNNKKTVSGMNLCSDGMQPRTVPRR
tara:strand:+ start:14568 stop:15023 length:456 start_codon:yes stop_codon:yes gene_type:complete